jgi:dynein assembly factor 2
MHRKKGGTENDGGGGGGKLFLNIVYSDRVAGPIENETERPGGSSWSVPYALGPQRMERNKAGMNLVPALDVCFHPLSLRYAHANKGFRDLVISIAKEAASNAFVASGDEADILVGYTILRGVPYKSGTPRALMIGIDASHEEATSSKMHMVQTIEPRAQSHVEITVRSCVGDGGICVPRYKIAERRAFDIAEHATTTRTRTSDIPMTRRPSHLIVTIYLDEAMTTMTSADDINLDVRERELKIIPDSKCGYQLEVALPYPVDPKRGDASFDRKRRTLLVTLPVA